MGMKPGRPIKTGPFSLVSATVLLQLAAAWVLGRAASHQTTLLLGILAVGLAIGLNLMRFAIWGYAHRHFPLSHTYPLTALFFPCVLALSYFNGDAVTSEQVIGTLLITFGALAMASPGATRRDGHV